MKNRNRLRLRTCKQTTTISARPVKSIGGVRMSFATYLPKNNARTVGEDRTQKRLSMSTSAWTVTKWMVSSSALRIGFILNQIAVNPEDGSRQFVEE
jgi:hypothetical protein